VHVLTFAMEMNLIQHDSRNAHPESPGPHRDSHILVSICFLAIVACAGAALAVQALVSSHSPSTSTRPSNDAQAVATPETGDDPGVPKASVVSRDPEVAEAKQPHRVPEQSSDPVRAAGKRLANDRPGISRPSAASHRSPS